VVFYWQVLELESVSAGKVPCSAIFGTFEEALRIIMFTMLSVSSAKIVKTVKEKQHC
jgi:hypothetical protein